MFDVIRVVIAVLCLAGAVIIAVVMTVTVVVTVAMFIVFRLLNQLHGWDRVIAIVVLFSPVHRPFFTGLQCRHLNRRRFCVISHFHAECQRILQVGRQWRLCGVDDLLHLFIFTGTSRLLRDILVRVHVRRNLFELLRDGELYLRRWRTVAAMADPES